MRDSWALTVRLEELCARECPFLCLMMKTARIILERGCCDGKWLEPDLNSGCTRAPPPPRNVSQHAPHVMSTSGSAPINFRVVFCVCVCACDNAPAPVCICIQCTSNVSICVRACVYVCVYIKLSLDPWLSHVIWVKPLIYSWKALSFLQANHLHMGPGSVTVTRPLCYRKNCYRH